MRLRHLGAMFSLGILVGPTLRLHGQEPDFSHDVRPVLAKHCFKCHGPDEKTRKAKLRLDGAIKTDDATLLAKQKEMSGLRQKLQDKMAQMMIEGRKILTPEQLQKLDRMGMGSGGGMGFGMMDGGMMGHGMMDGSMMGRGMMGRDMW